MATNITYKCPTCGAELFWKADKNLFVCEYCDDSFTLEQLEHEGQGGKIDEENVERHEELDEAEYTKSNDGTIGDNLVKYTCSHCGAEIITDRSTAATVCVYCGNAVIMGEQVIDDFAPDYVIPFKIDKKRVMEEFQRFSKKPLTPKDFNCERVLDKMQGVYIPFWLYSGRCNGKLSAEGVNVHSWRSGDYEYTERKYYAVFRDGTVNFDKVPVDGSSKTDNDAMDSIEPYDYSEIKPFNTAYLSGFLAERYDEDSDKCFARARERIETTTKDMLRESMRYDLVKEREYDKKIKLTDAEYALLPTWLLYTTYKDKKYFFAMNGQTEKFIGNLPIDKLRLTIFSLLGGVAGSLLGIICSMLFM